MDGVFFNGKNTKIFNILGLLAGIYLVLQFGSFLFADAIGDLEDILGGCFFILFGFFMIVLCAVSLYVNRKAYIHVDEYSISAYCHFGLSLECTRADVADVTYGGGGLNILLNNGKKYNLMALENAYEIGRYIQKRMPAKPLEECDIEALLSQLPAMKKKCIREGVIAICTFFLVIPGIFITAALTGWKDMRDFATNDWIVFLVMMALGIIDTIVMCVFLRKYLQHLEERNKKQRILLHARLIRSPLRPGNAIKLFFVDAGSPSIRLTVFGYPNSSDVYYTVERVGQNFEIECIFESAVYASFEDMEEELEDMVQINLPEIS